MEDVLPAVVKKVRTIFSSRHEERQRGIYLLKNMIKDDCMWSEDDFTILCSRKKPEYLLSAAKLQVTLSQLGLLNLLQIHLPKSGSAFGFQASVRKGQPTSHWN
jgi:hypothetical protein